MINLFARGWLFAAALLVSCETARDLALTPYHVTHSVAVGSYHAVAAPVHLVHRAIASDNEAPGATTSATTTTTTSDVGNQGGPVSTVSSTPSPRRVASSDRNAAATSKPSPQPRTTSAEAHFPTAKPVPGRPGLVYNPYDPNGGYIDVSGYAAGSKVKDPDSQKIFIVP